MAPRHRQRLWSVLVVLAVCSCSSGQPPALGAGEEPDQQHQQPRDGSAAAAAAAAAAAPAAAAPAAPSAVDAEYVRGMVQAMVEQETQGLRRENHALRTELVRLKAATEAAFEGPPDGQGRQRSRRSLNDITSVERVAPVELFASPADAAVGQFSNPGQAATTGARAWLFFELTPANQQTVAFGSTFVQGQCLALASSLRCEQANCSSVTPTAVEQKVFSWDVIAQRWLESGPGATGAGLGPIVGDGVHALAHFSPDGVEDFLMTAAFEGAATANAEPTLQPGRVFRYDRTLGWRPYQSDWQTSGARDVTPFQILGEQYVFVSGMVQRTYDANASIASESYGGVPNFILKWSARTRDNQGRSTPYGFFLSGGEAGSALQPADRGFNPAVGNNGTNVWQVLQRLEGVVDVEAFTINDEVFLGVSEHVSNAACSNNGLGDGSETPSCQRFLLNSHIFRYDPFLVNPRGDCPSTGVLPGCVHYTGEFSELQAIPTHGARAMKHFSVRVTGEVIHFLAVAEHYRDSAVYRWNGREFGLFQRLPTQFADSLDAFTSGTRTFLVIANRGCADVERRDSRAMCEGSTEKGRARVFFFNVFSGEFELQPEGSSVGHLHAFGADFETHPSDIEAALNQFTAQPVGVTAFQLPSFDVFQLGPPVQYVAVANFKVLATDLVGSCPDPDNRLCTAPASLFTVSTDVQSGVSSQVTTLADQLADQRAFSQDLQSKLDGDRQLAINLARNLDLDQTFFAPRAIEPFRIGGVQYVAVGFSQGFITTKQCVAMYANASSEGSECGYLRAHNRSTVVALAEHCSLLCDMDPADGARTLVNHKTETVVYRLGDAEKGTGFRDEAINVQGPNLIEVQRLPSMGVTDLVAFPWVEPATQAGYEACDPAASNGTAVAGVPCFNSSAAAVKHMLVVVNHDSTCERDLVGGALNPPDPRRRVELFEWDTDAGRFASLTVLRSDVQCQAVSVRPFKTDCQEVAGNPASIPRCASYLAVAENCVRETAAGATNATMRVAFHRWNANGTALDHCQPYADPLDPRNHLESVCRQPTDPNRAPGIVQTGDQHTYDFPDLLPRALGFVDDESDFFPQLEGSNIKGLALSVPTGQKDTFFLNEAGLEGAAPVGDGDALPRTAYFENGRRHYEVTLTVVYGDRGVPPQVFGLEAVRVRGSACVAAGAPTTPRRRRFAAAQSLPGTSGGLAAETFERTSVAGHVKSYLIAPEKHRRTTVLPGRYLPGLFSSLFVHEVCSEYTPLPSSRAYQAGGIFEPIDPANPTGKSCPYSLASAEFEAWEAFRNYYNPVSPCRGRTADLSQPQSATVFQEFFNSRPPADLLQPLDAAAATGQYVHLRPSPVELSTHFYSAEDYQFLHDHRDDPWTKLQDLPTFGANGVVVHRVCGAGGQLWALFANDGFAINRDELFRPLPLQVDPPRAKNLLFVWNDHFAVAANGMDCTAAAARERIAAVGLANAQLGCFVAEELTVPVNSGAALDIAVFETGDFLLMLHANFAEGTAQDIDFRGVQRDTPNGRAQTDPDMCLASGAGRTPGVRSPMLTVDLALHGGLQCRQFITSRSGGATATPSEVTLEALAATFVTLDTAQNITGAKRFAAPLAVDNDLDVAGETVVEGDVSAANVNTLGTVDNVDLSELANRVARTEGAAARKLAELEARVCENSNDVTRLARRLSSGNVLVCLPGFKEDPIAQSCVPEATGACQAVARRTGCFPTDGQSDRAYELLRSSFEQFVLDAAPGVDEVLAVSFAVDSNLFFFVVTDAEGQAGAVAAGLDASGFNVPEFCSLDQNPEPEPGFVLANDTVRFVLLDCAAFNVDRAEEFSIVTAAGLASLGVRATDVVVTDVRCHGSGNGTVVEYYVQIPTLLEGGLLAELADEAFWAGVYERLVATDPLFYLDEPLVLEYARGQFAPPDDSGSGSGLDPSQRI